MGTFFKGILKVFENYFLFDLKRCLTLFSCYFLFTALFFRGHLETSYPTSILFGGRREEKGQRIKWLAIQKQNIGAGSLSHWHFLPDKYNTNRQHLAETDCLPSGCQHTVWQPFEGGTITLSITSGTINSRVICLVTQFRY